MEAEIAKQVSYKFECKKDRLAQTQDGAIKVTFNIQPMDMPPELYTDMMGQRYLCVLVPLNDDETPRAGTLSKPKSFAGQAKIMAQDADFQCYLTWRYNGKIGKANPEQGMKDILGIKSCSELVDGTAKGRDFKELQKHFLQWQDRKRQEEYYTR